MRNMSETKTNKSVTQFNIAILHPYWLKKTVTIGSFSQLPGALYRVGLVVVDLDFDLIIPSCCPAAQPNSNLPKHNQAGSGMTQI